MNEISDLIPKQCHMCNMTDTPWFDVKIIEVHHSFFGFTSFPKTENVYRCRHCGTEWNRPKYLTYTELRADTLRKEIEQKQIKKDIINRALQREKDKQSKEEFYQYIFNIPNCKRIRVNGYQQQISYQMGVSI